MLIAWITFAGAWLLVIGPLLQASTDLVDASSKAHEGRPPGISAWWWLVPPLMYALSQRGLRNEDRKTRAFRTNATGWFAVAGGGALLAVGATSDVAERLEIGTAGFVVLYVMMLVLSSLYTSVRMIVRSNRTPNR